MQISFDRLFAKKLQFFFAKLVQSVSLCHRLSKKLNFIKIWQLKVGQNKDLVCYWKKQSFRQYKSLVLGLNGWLLVFRKSQKISTASDQYFLSYVKKNYRGGNQIAPPPSSRHRVNNHNQNNLNQLIRPNCWIYTRSCWSYTRSFWYFK